MPDSYLRQSPLAHLHLQSRAVGDAGITDAGVTLSEIPHRDMLNLRGRQTDKNFMAASETSLGLALPTDANTAASKRGMDVLWLAPDEWLIVTPAGKSQAAMSKLSNALKPIFAALTPVGEGRTVIRVSGPCARDVLAKGCPLDLHPAAFGPGQCAQTLIGRCDMLLHQTNPGRAEADIFDIYVLRSFAEYLWTWLEDAGREYGVRISDA